MRSSGGSGNLRLTEEHVPELRLSASAEAALIEPGILAWITLFSILFDPAIDDEYKRRHASNMTLFIDGNWYVAYQVLDSGDIYVGFVHYEPQIDGG